MAVVRVVAVLIKCGERRWNVSPQRVLSLSVRLLAGAGGRRQGGGGRGGSLRTSPVHPEHAVQS